MIAGIDLSTRCIDIVAIDEDDPSLADHLAIQIQARGWFHAARSIRRLFAEQELYGWLQDRNVHLIGVEQPFGPSRQTIAALHAVLGGVVASLPQRMVVLEITPADMRQCLGLPGNCAKELMHERIPPFPRWPADALDAWAVAHAALKLCENGVKAA